jgi:hypothetical protein
VSLQEEARKTLAWEDIDDEDSEKLDDGQRKQLAENLKKAGRDLKESVWRTYKNIVLLSKDNKLRVVDLGLVHSSAADNLVTFILNRLRQDGDLEDGVSPNFLLRNWPPAFTEWSTKLVRDSFFASPQFPRLLNADAVKETIARGVASGHLGYVGKRGSRYEPFNYAGDISSTDIEISDDMFIISKDTALKYRSSATPTTEKQATVPTSGDLYPFAPTEEAVEKTTEPSTGTVSGTTAAVSTLKWTGEVPSQKWMNFYTKVLSRFAASKGLKLTVSVEASPEDAISVQKLEETKVALRELGLKDDVRVE